MTSSMQGFALDIESRLNKAYKGGVDKKFGISDINQESARSSGVTKAPTEMSSKDLKNLDLSS